MLGTVISSDMDIIGQLQPSTKVHFKSVDMDLALKARKEYNSLISDLFSLFK